ncbi:hypothetical protein BDD12DRAFT_840064 [Trichophaea hybrida]|nr:hypothetical protein BDD12DRAFT_840064 [Trichophaea hybrida]
MSLSRLGTAIKPHPSPQQDGHYSFTVPNVKTSPTADSQPPSIAMVASDEAQNTTSETPPGSFKFPWPLLKSHLIVTAVFWSAYIGLCVICYIASHRKSCGPPTTYALGVYLFLELYVLAVYIYDRRKKPPGKGRGASAV